MSDSFVANIDEFPSVPEVPQLRADQENPGTKGRLNHRERHLRTERTPGRWPRTSYNVPSGSVMSCVDDPNTKSSTTGVSTSVDSTQVAPAERSSSTV